MANPSSFFANLPNTLACLVIVEWCPENDWIVLINALLKSKATLSFLDAIARKDISVVLNRPTMVQINDIEFMTRMSGGGVLIPMSFRRNVHVSVHKSKLNGFETNSNFKFHDTKSITSFKLTIDDFHPITAKCFMKSLKNAVYNFFGIRGTKHDTDLINSCTNLKELYVVYFAEDMPQDYFAKLDKNLLKKLEKLHLSIKNQDNVIKFSITNLVSTHCENLVEIYLYSRDVRMSPDNVQQLTKNNPTLQNITFEVLVVDNNENINNTVLDIISKNCHNLKHIKLYHYYFYNSAQHQVNQLSWVSVSNMFQKHHNIQTCSLDHGFHFSRLDDNNITIQKIKPNRYNLLHQLNTALSIQFNTINIDCEDGNDDRYPLHVWLTTDMVTELATYNPNLTTLHIHSANYELIKCVVTHCTKLTSFFIGIFAHDMTVTPFIEILSIPNNIQKLSINSHLSHSVMFTTSDVINIFTVSKCLNTLLCRCNRDDVLNTWVYNMNRNLISWS